jgi:hypothetical protein
MISIKASKLNSTSPVVGIQITAPAPPTGARRSFHLALLLDTSGSMEGPRISALKRTLTLLVDSMKPDDALTLIAYNSTATVKAKAETNKENLHHAVSEMKAEGGTCLESGIHKLSELLRNETEFRRPDAVFLMTDGQINRGITSSAGLSSLLETCLSLNGVSMHIPVSTVGYGQDHNAHLLQHLAVTTRGAYTFASSDEVLPAVIGNIMTGCEDEVARGMRIALPSNCVCLELGSKKHDEEYLVGSIISEKPQWVILESAAPPTTLTVKWESPETNETRTETIAIESPDEESKDIMEQWYRARVVDMVHKYNECNVFTARFAIEKIQELEKEIRSSAVSNNVLCHHLLAQLAELKDLLEKRGHGGGHDYEDTRNVTRLISDTTYMGMQRGILSQTYTANVPDPSPFVSPRQRETTGSMIRAFSQQPSEDPL